MMKKRTKDTKDSQIVQREIAQIFTRGTYFNVKKK